MTPSSVIEFLLSQPFLWQSTLWLLLGLAGSRALDKRPAQAHAILLATLVGAFVSPALSLLAGRLGWSLLPRRVVEVGMDWAAGPAGAVPASAHRIETFLYVTSGLMLAACLFGFLRSIVAARTMLRECVPVADQGAIHALALAQQRSSREYDVTLLERPEFGSPSIWCWANPAIILVPLRLSSHLSVECLTSIFQHELAHLTRRDHIKSMMANVLASSIGWNPLAWFVRARLRQLAEQACDAAASRSNRASADYAEALLQLAVGTPPRLGLAIARHAGLTSRVRKILEGQDSRLTIGRRFFGLLGAVVLVSSTLLAPLQRAQGVAYEFDAGLRATPMALELQEQDLQAGILAGPPECGEGNELVALSNGSWFCALGGPPGAGTSWPPSGGDAGQEGGAFFIHATSDGPAGLLSPDPVPASERPHWISED